jgi:FMN phosphatase YigB (HAD superfamily)
MVVSKKKISPFVKFLKKRDIQYVGFDIDNTLIPTNLYYSERISSVIKQIYKYLNISDDLESVSQEYSNIFLNRYINRGKLPMNISDEVLGALQEYLGYMNKDIESIVKENLSDFYMNSTDPYDSAYEILKILKKNSIEFVLCSHAEDDWTNVKVNLLGKELNIDIPYLAVGLSNIKNANSWKEAFKLIDGDISKSLIIGDSLDADILSGIESGCKNVIWIDLYGKGLSDDDVISDGVKLIIVKDLSEIVDFNNIL